MRKGCTVLSVQLHTGIDYLMSLPVGELNEIAETFAKITEEVSKHGKK